MAMKTIKIDEELYNTISFQEGNSMNKKLRTIIKHYKELKEGTKREPLGNPNLTIEEVNSLIDKKIDEAKRGY